MTQTQQEEVNLLKELIADSSISAEERDIYEGALSELMKSEKPKASTERKPKATTERKPRTTTQRKPQAPKQSKSDIELAKAEIKRRTGKTEEECESIVNEYRSLRAKSVERKKKETIASADNKDRVAKLKKDDKIISGTSEKTADAVIESTTKDVAEKIVKEIDKIEQKAEIEATKEVKKEMPKESTTEQNKVIAEKTEEKVKAIVKRKTKNIIIDTSDLLTSIAESLGRFDKDSQKEFLIKLRSDIDKLLAKFSYGGSTMGATQGYNITQSNLSSSSVNPTMFGGGGGVGAFKIIQDTNGIYEQGFYGVFDTNNNYILDIFQFKYEAQNYLKAIKEKGLDNVDASNFNGQIENYKKGGKVNTGLSWHLDRAKFNKSEDYEIPLSKRKFDEGGGVENGYMVFNYSDEYYATDNVFATKKEANNFIKEFRNRYKQQGYFRDNRMNKIAIEDIDLEIIPSDFNPFRKFNGGGGVDGNPSKKEMLDYLNMYFDNYSELRTIAIEEDNILTRKMLNSLDDEELEMAYDDAKYEIKADTQFDNGGGVNSGLNYGKKDDVFIEVITLLNSKLEKPTFMGKQTNTKQVMSLDSFMEFIKKYEYDERYEVNVPIELFTKESFNQYNSDNSKLKFITGSISLLGKEDLLKKYIRNKESLLSNRLTYKEIEKINDRSSIKNAPEKTTIVKRIVSKQLLENGGGVEMNDSPKRKFIGQMTDRESFAVNEGYDPDEEYFFDEDDYEEDSIGSNAG